VEQAVVEHIVDNLSNQYWQEEPIYVHWGKMHDYLGMHLDQPNKLIVSMAKYIKNLLAEAPKDM